MAPGKQLSAIPSSQKPRKILKKKQEWHREGNKAGSHPRDGDEGDKNPAKVRSPRKKPKSGSRKKNGPHGWD